MSIHHSNYQKVKVKFGGTVIEVPAVIAEYVEALNEYPNNLSLDSYVFNVRTITAYLSVFMNDTLKLQDEVAELKQSAVDSELNWRYRYSKTLDENMQLVKLLRSNEDKMLNGGK